MKKGVHSLILAVGLLAAVSAVNAGQTTWEFQGHLTGSDPGSVWPADFTVGTPYRILVSYDPVDPANTLIRTFAGQKGGYRYVWKIPSLQYKIFLGTTCTPCEPANDAGFDPTLSRVIIRDDYDDGPDIQTQQPTGPVDGVTFSLVTGDGNTIALLMRGPNTNVVIGSVIPVTPDPRLLSFNPQDPLTLIALDVDDPCNTKDSSNNCVDGNLFGNIETVAVPTYGTNWFLSARDCYYIDSNPLPPPAAPDSLPNNCVQTSFIGGSRLGFGRLLDSAGGAGQGEFTRIFAPTSSFPGASNGQSLGTVFGSVSFGGPAALPVVKTSSTPSNISRTNGNVQAYQKYQYTGAAATQMPLVIDLSYGIADYSDPTDATAGSETGLRPGGAAVSAVLAIVDGDRVSIPAVAASSFGSLTCGAEPTLVQPDGSAWPVGSILGTAVFGSPDGQKNAQVATQLRVTSCTQPGQPVTLAAGQSFVVATSMQTPARGQWTLSSSVPTGNGYADASHTLRVTFDPNAPPALVQQLADSIAPACTTCDFVPETTTVGVDVQPGATGCINPGRNGVIPVAILGSEKFNVKTVRLDDSLKLDSLALRARNGKPSCSISNVNGDAYDDLVCNFENVSTNWKVGQTTVTVLGKLLNGLPIQGSDTICIK